MFGVLGIGAWDRSGSTILANVLGSVEGVVSVGEVNNLWQRGVVEDRLCACENRFSSCPFWRPVMTSAFDDAAGQSLLEGTVRAHDQLGNRDVVRKVATGRWSGPAEAYAAGLRTLYDAIARHSQAALIVDSAKKPWHLAIASDLAADEFSALHLVRDPRGVAYSLRKKMRYDPDSQRQLELDRLGTTFTSLGWHYRNRLLAMYWRTSSRYLRLTYEEFAESPRATTATILDWVGLQYDDLPFSPAGDEVTLALSHNVSGNPVRFQHGQVRIEPDDEWRHNLDGLRRCWVETLTWPMATRYGYRT